MLIYKEALTNIIKYAEADQVLIELKQSKSLSLRIYDNGIGFNVDDPLKQRAFGGNGLVNMKVKSKRIGAVLQLTSNLMSGTQIKLEVYERA